VDAEKPRATISVTYHGREGTQYVSYEEGVFDPELSPPMLFPFYTANKATGSHGYDATSGDLFIPVGKTLIFDAYFTDFQFLYVSPFYKIYLQYNGVIASIDYHIVDNTDIVWTRVNPGERVPFRGTVDVIRIRDDVRPNISSVYYPGRYVFNDLFRDIRKSEGIPLIAYDQNNEAMDFNAFISPLNTPVQLGSYSYPPIEPDMVLPMERFRMIISNVLSGTETSTFQGRVLTSVELPVGNGMVDHLDYYADDYISIVRLCPPDDTFVDDEDTEDVDDNEEGDDAGDDETD
jgi:hypothetical protein